MRRWAGIPPWLVIPGETRRALRWVVGSGRGAASEAHDASARVGTERDQSHRVPSDRRWERSTPTDGRVPSDRRDQLRTAERCPGKKDLNTPATGLAGNEGIEHPVHRPALPARDLNTPRRQLSLWWTAPLGEDPGRGRNPQVSRAGNTGKPDNAVIVARSRPAG